MPARCAACTTEQVLAGFAGGTADAFTLFELFDGSCQIRQPHARAIELARTATGRYLRRLERCWWWATRQPDVISGNGDVTSPSCRWRPSGPAAVRAIGGARAVRNTTLSARDIVEKSMVSRRYMQLHQSHLSIEELPGSPLERKLDQLQDTLHDSARDRRGARQAHHRAAGRQARVGHPCATPLAPHAIEEPMRHEITPKNSS